MECYAPAIYGGPPKRAGGILGRIGPSYPYRGQIFSELIALCVQLIAFSVLTFYIVAWHNKLWKQSSFHSIKELIP